MVLKPKKPTICNGSGKLSSILLLTATRRYPSDSYCLYPVPGGYTICEQQVNLWQGHLTTLQLVIVISQLADATNKHPGAILLDMSRAFVKVGHEDLVFILSHTPLLLSTQHLTQSYLTDRTFRCATIGHGLGFVSSTHAFL